MRRWMRSLRKALAGRPRTAKLRSYRLAVEPLEDRQLLSADYLQTNLVSDIPGMAQVLDKNLVNPWGLVAGPTTPFWVSDNNAGVSTLYTGQGQKLPLEVHIPAPGDPAGSSGTPTGTVFNTTLATKSPGFTVSDGTHSGPAIFLFDTEDGTVLGWNPGVDPTGQFDGPGHTSTHAVIAVDNSANPSAADGAVYKGLTIGKDLAGDTLLYGTNFRSGHIDVFDQSFNLVNLPGGFADTSIPDGFAPFNIQAINGNFYVTYAKQNATKHDDVAGQGNGFVDVFNGDGVLQQHLIRRGQLDSPWGVAIAPANFGGLSGDLLVGNFGNGHINAFDPSNGHFIGAMQDATDHTVVIDDLWALRFGNGAAAGPTNTLFFTAGIVDETHGLFGSLQAISTVKRAAAILPNLPSAAMQTFSTVPPNGDQNPYGVAFVPQDFRGRGVLHPGDMLVSNFNNSQNQQGTGTTIVRTSPTGEHSVFFQGQAGLGLTTALGVLKRGFVIVGSLPTSDGTSATLGTGSLLILDSSGHLVTTLTGTLLDSPWDLTINDKGDRAQVFVSNVLSGTVTRIDLKIPEHGNPIVESETLIDSGFATGTDPAALVVGPTGLAFDAKTGTLYVASTKDNAIFAIPDAGTRESDAGTGELVFQDNTHLHGPLGLILAPNGDLITANGDAVNQDPGQPSELVEFTRSGRFVAQFSVDPGTGGAFGLAAATFGDELRFAAVDDNTNSLDVWTFDL